MQDGCRVFMDSYTLFTPAPERARSFYLSIFMDSYMASNASCFMVTWTILKNHLLEGGHNTKSGYHGTSNAHNR